jgi:hypothetical protein
MSRLALMLVAFSILATVMVSPPASADTLPVVLVGKVTWTSPGCYDVPTWFLCLVTGCTAYAHAVITPLPNGQVAMAMQLVLNSTQSDGTCRLDVGGADGSTGTGDVEHGWNLTTVWNFEVPDVGEVGWHSTYAITPISDGHYSFTYTGYSESLTGELAIVA